MTDAERIGELEAEVQASDERHVNDDAVAMLRDARIAELVAHIDGILNAQEHRAIIERAKGVIMSTMHCGPEVAFAVLVAQSQDQNRKVNEIAAELAAMQDRS